MLQVAGVRLVFVHCRVSIGDHDTTRTDSIRAAAGSAALAGLTLVAGHRLLLELERHVRN